MLLIALFCSFSVPRRYCVVRIAHSAADIHETAATAVVRGASTPRMICKPGSCRDETSNDDVFLQAAQVVLQAPYRRLGEHAGGLLERCRRNEGFRRQRRLGDTKQQRFPGGLVLALGLLLRNHVEHSLATHS